MNAKFSLIAAGTALVLFSSCSSVYKSGQTPDDVYFSPGKPVTAVAKNEQYLETNSRNNYGSRNNSRYEDESYRDDQYLRMMIGSGRRSMYYNDFAMVDPWMYNNWRWNSYMTWNSGFNSPWNSMWYWNSYYNPYCAPVYGYPGKGSYGGGFGGYAAPRPSRPVSAFSMSSYLNTNGTNNRSGYTTGRYYGNSYNNANSNSNNNNNRRPLFNINNGNNSNNNLSNERPSRSYTPANNSNSGAGSSRSSSGSSSSGSVSRPTRTGGN
jgi:hypothetical protein